MPMFDRKYPCTVNTSLLLVNFSLFFLFVFSPLHLLPRLINIYVPSPSSLSQHNRGFSSVFHYTNVYIVIIKKLYLLRPYYLMLLFILCFNSMCVLNRKMCILHAEITNFPDVVHFDSLT